MSTADLLARSLPSLAVIVGALLLLRHWARRSQAGPTGVDVRVIARTGIAKGATVAVVAVGDRRLVVGASEHGVNLLTPLDDDEGATPPTSPTGVPEDAATPTGCSPLNGRAPLTWTTDRPRMAPIDRLRRLTVRQPVPSHPRRPNGVPSRP